jgi:hypothetical protein
MSTIINESDYVNKYGVAVNYLEYKEVGYHTLPVKDHPVHSGKFAKIQRPIFIPNVGYFIYYKNCSRTGEIKNGTHEEVKCICKNLSACTWHKKRDEVEGNSFSHPCVNSRFRPLQKIPPPFAGIAESKIQDELLEKHIDLALDADMSLQSATGPALYGLVHHAMEHMRQHPTAKVDEVFKERHRTTFSKDVKKSAHTKKEDVLKRLEGKPCCVVMDGGKKGKRSFVAVLLLLPFLLIAPFFYCLAVCDGTGDGYAKLAATIIEELAQRHIRVVSFCTDGLRHQVLALMLNSELCFNKHLILPVAAFFSPCLCHRIHLAYNDVIKFCPFLSEQIARVNDLVVFLRNKSIQETILLICPTTVKTRWIYILRILQWLIVHYAAFSSIAGVDIISINELKMLYLLFLPYFILVCKFERNDSSIEIVHPHIFSAVNFYSLLESVTSIQSSDNLQGSVRYLSFFLLRRTLDSPHKNKFASAFLISPLGRACFRFVRLFSFSFTLAFSGRDLS